MVPKMTSNDIVTPKVNGTPSFDFESSYGAHVPEDKDQALVQTPYGKAMVIRSRKLQPENGSSSSDMIMREMELTDWTQASNDDQATKSSPNTSQVPSSSAPKRPAKLFSPTKYPSVDPNVGDDVICLYGRGRVVEIRPPSDANDHPVVVVLLSSWRLAGRSRVTCYLQMKKDAIQVVRKKKLYEMNVYEKVEYAQQLKARAAEQFAAKQYDEALQTYSYAVDAVRYVQHNKTSSNEVRADLLVTMVTCSNNAGTCCLQLDRKDEAHRFATLALSLIDAMEERKGNNIHKVLNREGTSDAKFFGQWKVKSYLLIARAVQKNDADQAIDVLKKAHDVIAYYTGPEQQKLASTADAKKSIQQLVVNDKEVKKLHAHCKERRKLLKEKEKKRAQKMFASTSGGNESPAKETPTKSIFEEEKKEIQEGSPILPFGLPKFSTEPMKKQVSFSEHVREKVYDPSKEEHMDDNSVQEHLAKMKAAASTVIAKASGFWSGEDEAVTVVAAAAGVAAGVALTCLGWHFLRPSKS